MISILDSNPDYYAIVPAAGVGSRMGGDTPKQYLSLLGKPLLAHTIERLCSFQPLRKILVAVAAEDIYYPQIESLKHSSVGLVEGGQERCHSVFNALDLLMSDADPNDWVLVHDVARPCVRISDLHRLVTALDGHDIGGLLGVPVHDTMKRTNSQGTVEHSVQREHLWHAYTPQMFRLGILHQAMEKVLDDGLLVTDEAQAMEMAGYAPLMVEGCADNIKVTRPQDLALAEFYLQQQMIDVSAQSRDSGV